MWLYFPQMCTHPGKGIALAGILVWLPFLKCLDHSTPGCVCVESRLDESRQQRQITAKLGDITVGILENRRILRECRMTANLVVRLQ
jgi:hypothetical protein